MQSKSAMDFLWWRVRQATYRKHISCRDVRIEYSRYSDTAPKANGVEIQGIWNEIKETKCNTLLYIFVQTEVIFAKVTQNGETCHYRQHHHGGDREYVSERHIFTYNAATTKYIDKEEWLIQVSRNGLFNPSFVCIYCDHSACTT